MKGNNLSSSALIFSDENKKHIIDLACRAGKVVLENGGEIYRVEETMINICTSYGVLDCESFATPTIIMLSTSSKNGDAYSRMMRITERSINMDKISRIINLSRKMPIDITEAFAELKSIERDAGHKLWVRVLMSGIAVGVFAIMFGGSLRDAVGGLIIGALIRLFITLLQKKRAGDFMVNLVGGAASALSGWILGYIGLLDNQWIVTVSALMLMVPGLLFTNALRDIAAGDLVSGSSRGVEVLSVAAALASGTAAVYAVLAFLFGGGLL